MDATVPASDVCTQSVRTSDVPTQPFGREKLGYVHLEARWLPFIDAYRFNVGQWNARKIDACRLEPGCLDMKHLDAASLDARDLDIR